MLKSARPSVSGYFAATVKIKEINGWSPWSSTYIGVRLLPGDYEIELSVYVSEKSPGMDLGNRYRIITPLSCIAGHTYTFYYDFNIGDVRYFDALASP